MKLWRKLKLVGLVVALAIGGLAGAIVLLNAATAHAADPTDVHQDFGISQFQAGGCTCAPHDTLDCRDFASREQAQTCFDTCLASTGYDVYDLDKNGNGLACETVAYGVNPVIESPVTTEENVSTEPEVVPGANNLIANGNFEYGFYTVPELGFEPPDTGSVPNNWGWFKSNTYGKVTIQDNQEFGIVCRDDTGAAAATNEPPDDNSPFGPIPGVVYRRPNNSVSFYIQNSDQQDMRLGIYQTVNVVPGQDYRFTMSGTIQVQNGATTLQPDDPEAPRQAQNHTVEVYFDQTGGTNWKKIPLEKRHVVEFKEEPLEFKTTIDEPDIATIQDFETIVRARSNKMTIFIDGWRKWANWRATRFTIDCISLVPIDLSVAPSPQSLPARADQAQPAAITQPSGSQSTPEETTQIIPPSGGILEKAGNSVLFAGVSIIVLLGLVGAGVWNMRR